MDAISRTLYRVWISKQRLLEWTSSSQLERNKGKSRPVILGYGGGYSLIILFAIGAALQPQPSFMWAGLALSLFWMLAPLAISWLDKPVVQDEVVLDSTAKEQLRLLAKQIWAFYEDFAGPQDHFLPPDNVQIEPSNGIAHRTSPTNIGFLLTAALAAREFGFINTSELVERLDQTVSTVERLSEDLHNLQRHSSSATVPQMFQPWIQVIL